MASQPLAQDWQRPPSEACPLQPLTDMVRIAVSTNIELYKNPVTLSSKVFCLKIKISNTESNSPFKENFTFSRDGSRLFYFLESCDGFKLFLIRHSLQLHLQGPLNERSAATSDE